MVASRGSVHNSGLKLAARRSPSLSWWKEKGVGLVSVVLESVTLPLLQTLPSSVTLGKSLKLCALISPHERDGVSFVELL